jgi:pimeloyl-ACP methyl ester carboxylesterase
MMAPIISLLFWSIAMRLACDANNARREQVIDFRAPFRGLRGAWRLMALLRWGDPAEVLASIPTILPRLLAPTLIFHGSKDPAVPPDFALRAAGLIPNSEVILLDSGHFLPMNEPGVIAGELHRFFTIGEQGDPECRPSALAVGA